MERGSSSWTQQVTASSQSLLQGWYLVVLLGVNQALKSEFRLNENTFILHNFDAWLLSCPQERVVWLGAGWKRSAGCCW